MWNEVKDLRRSKQEGENKTALLSRLVESSRESLEIVNDEKEALENTIELWKSKYKISEEENGSLRQMCCSYFQFLEQLKSNVYEIVGKTAGRVIEKLESLVKKMMKLISVRLRTIFDDNSSTNLLSATLPNKKAFT